MARVARTGEWREGQEWMGWPGSEHLMVVKVASTGGGEDWVKGGSEGRKKKEKKGEVKEEEKKKKKKKKKKEERINMQSKLKIHLNII